MGQGEVWAGLRSGVQCQFCAGAVGVGKEMGLSPELGMVVLGLWS